MPKKFLALLPLVFFGLSASLTLSAKDIALKIATRSGQELIYNFSDFDDKRLTFEFKLGKQEREIALKDVRTIFLDTTLSDSQKMSDTLDIFSLKDGSTLKGIFKKIEGDEVKALILENGLKEKKIPNNSLKKIDFSLNILDVDRREFGKGFNLFGKDIELELANGFASDIEKEAQPLEDTLVNNYVDRLGKKIAAFSKRSDLDYQFKVLNSSQINAFTIGGGKVYVYRGLLDQMDNESELAGVLGHEIGHNVGKHTVKQLSKTLLYNGIISATGELINSKSEKWAEVFKEAGGAASYFALMKFSRDDEREADYLGVYNLYKMGYDPNGMVTLFEKFKKMQDHEPSKFEIFFQTHPKPSERMENTSSEISKLKVEYLKKDGPEFQTVKQHLLQLPQPIMKKVVIYDTLQVDAQTTRSYTIDLNTDILKNCVLKGQFVASGGSGNDIKIAVYDAMNYLNWQNGHSASAMYQTDKLTTGEFNLPIKTSGKYYLVVDNSYSWFTDKVIVVDAWVEYTEK